VSGRTVKFTVKRTSGTGCDVPQVYLGFPGHSSDPSIPTKVLRFFQKVCDESAEVSHTFLDADVSNWDVDVKQWRVTTGTYDVSVGTSSSDISLTGTMTV